MSRKTLVIDELHITVSVPSKLGPAEYRSIRRALNRPGFRTALIRAVLDDLDPAVEALLTAHDLVIFAREVRRLAEVVAPGRQRSDARS